MIPTTVTTMTMTATTTKQHKPHTTMKQKKTQNLGAGTTHH